MRALSVTNRSSHPGGGRNSRRRIRNSPALTDVAVGRPNRLTWRLHTASKCVWHILYIVSKQIVCFLYSVVQKCPVHSIQCQKCLILSLYCQKSVVCTQCTPCSLTKGVVPVYALYVLRVLYSVKKCPVQYTARTVTSP